MALSMPVPLSPTVRRMYFPAFIHSRHSACTYTESFDKGTILAVCSNRSCPNKGANWVLQEITATVELYKVNAITRSTGTL